MKTIPMVLLAATLVGAGCGDAPATRSQPEPEAATATPSQQTSIAAGRSRRARGTRLVARGSEFGPMLFSAKRQAIYIFQNDPKGKSVCYGDCAEAWPPVFTDGRPVAGAGIRRSLLGTIKRRDGRRQVTYAGKPLYFYAHEGPGQVLCHNVNLNGGLWWVVGPNGKRRP